MWNYGPQPISLLPDYKSREERDEESVRKIAIVPPLAYEMNQCWPVSPKDQADEDEDLPVLSEEGKPRIPAYKRSLGLNRSVHSSGYRSRGGLSISELPFVSNSAASSRRRLWRSGSYALRIQELRFLAPHYLGNIGQVISHVMVNFDVYAREFAWASKHPVEPPLGGVGFPNLWEKHFRFFPYTVNVDCRQLAARPPFRAIEDTSSY
jgi:hypothetical protein